jgi:hypothetical protein
MESILRRGIFLSERSDRIAVASLAWAPEDHEQTFGRLMIRMK